MLSKFERYADIEEGIEKGIAIGEERGIAIGEKRGITIGEKKGRDEALNAAISFMEANGMTFEQINNFKTSQLNF